MQIENKIIHAILTIMLGTLGSKVLGFIREMVFIHQFGASIISDAFVLTRSIPDVLFSAFIIAISINFIPLYMRIDIERERQFFVSNFLNICVVLTIVGSIVIAIFPNFILRIFAFKISEETLQYAVPMLRIIAFSIIPFILGRLLQAYSQANYSFISTALLGCVTNLVNIFAYLIATESTYYILCIGEVVAQILVMFMMLYSAKILEFKYYFVLNLRDPKVKKVAVLTVPLLLGQFAESASLYVDRNLAATLGTGILSSMAYASLLTNAIGTLFASTVITATFPALSNFAINKKEEDFKSFFNKYFQILSFSLIPISVFVLLCSNDIVLCIFQNGALKSSSARIISESVIYYSIGILPLALQNYMVRCFYAFNDTKTPTYIVVLGLILNMILSIVGVNYWGHVGIASATSISYIFSFGVLVFLFKRKHKVVVYRCICKFIFNGLFISSVSALCLFCVFHIFGIPNSKFVRLFCESLLFFSVNFIFLFFTQKELCERAILSIKSYIVR